ncbi:MAG: undecaprenyldiphospho-muramoylpentapeptide beta-N-acetylglucosaminyltransferase, partial [Candidatus Latescibacteria bacterium]|nr:undecaprenyldiphospho-muramoylpentapeptide beta-N-acetylglucosaminyltransferase [Candidatus Latescibacterota bacterium]
AQKERLVMRVLFAAGGTGGHIYPAIAVAQEVRSMNMESEILFIAGTKEIEKRIISEAGFDCMTLPVMGLPRKASPLIFVFAWKLGVSIVKAIGYVRRFRPSVVMSTGGYVSGPTVIAARRLGIPVVIQEQNSFPGIANRRLAGSADIVLLGFGDAGVYFEGKAETLVTGNPVRADVASGDRNRSAESFGLDPAKKTVLVFGGSQGARVLNRTFAVIAERLAERDIQTIWQTGSLEYDDYISRDGAHDGKIRVLRYIDAMRNAYAAADIVVARAGAMTIAEINACGLPAVFVPLPTAAGNHQEHNARSLERAGAAVVITEGDLTPELCERTILNIVSSAETLGRMGKASEGLGRKDAARKIAELLFERYGMN